MSTDEQDVNTLGLSNLAAEPLNSDWQTVTLLAMLLTTSVCYAVDDKQDTDGGGRDR